MPLLKNRSDYMKVYRPKGTRYANGETKTVPEAAILSAEEEFFKEFRDIPRCEDRIYEVIGVTGGYAATLVEVIEPKDKL